MNNRLKKKTTKYLESYRNIAKDIEKVILRIDEINETLGIKSPVIDDMPRGNTNLTSDPTGNAAVKLTMLKEKYHNKYLRLIERRNEIETTIEQIDNHQLQDILYYRYIEGMTLEDTAYQLDISPRHIYRLMPKAIKAVGEIIVHKNGIDNIIDIWEQLQQKLIVQNFTNSSHVIECHVA